MLIVVIPNFPEPFLTSHQRGKFISVFPFFQGLILLCNKVHNLKKKTNYAHDGLFQQMSTFVTY